MNSRLPTVALLVLCGALVAGRAEAHAALVGASPSPDARTTAPSMIELHFSEALEPAFSGFSVSLNGTPVNVGSVTAAQGNTALMAMPGTKLPAGTYRISWHALSDDAHRSQGEYRFTVQ